MRKLLPFLTLIFVISCNKRDSIIPVFTDASDNVAANKKANNSAADAYSGEFVRNYFTMLCKISKSTPGFFPPQVARAYGYIGITNYEAVVNGISNAESLAGQINGLNKKMLPQINNQLAYNWGMASNAAIAEMIRRMFELTMSAANAISVDSAETANLLFLS